MNLSSELVSQFVKATKDNEAPKAESTVYGTIVEYEGEKYARIDGSDLLTPVITTTDISDGERVTITIKNHTATVTGNISSPSAKSSAVDDAVDQITEVEILVANKVDTEDLNAERARIDTLISDNVTIRGVLDANQIAVDEIKAENVEILEKVTARDADIQNIRTDKLDVTVADAKFATIESLDATDAKIHNLESTYGDFQQLTADKFEATDADISDLQANKLSATDIEGKYANIDFSNIDIAAIGHFFSTSGLIEDVIVGDGTITGTLVGVTISGDLIIGGTVVADKLVIQGEDGLYYKLNTDGVATEAEQTDYNSLNGSVIKAKSITATKISVSDLVAFGATIGGFKITNNALHSAAKSSVSNTTRGIYLDSDGQMAVGDASNFLKYYRKTDGTYALEISAASILLGGAKKSVETAISETRQAVDDIAIGGRNLLLGSATKKISSYLETSATTEYGVEVEEWLTTEAIRTYGTGGTASIFGTMGGTSWNQASDDSQAYSASIYIKNNHPTNTVTIAGNHLSGVYEDVAPLEVKRVKLVGLGNGWGFLQFNFKTAVAGNEFDITYWHPKIEFGNKPTDWTPAPEDMATADDLGIVETLAEGANEKSDEANSLIQQLSESISMLVTDGNGTSLMTQTEDGWTFSTADIQAIVDRTSEGLNDLTNEVGDVSGTVDVLKQAVDDLGAIAEYVKITTHEGEPCIELGEGDSEFKLRITNTRMIFTEGSSVLAYFNNKSLHIKKAVVEEELQQGGFVWKARSNGNLGLVWKGGAS